MIGRAGPAARLRPAWGPDRPVHRHQRRHQPTEDRSRSIYRPCISPRIRALREAARQKRRGLPTAPQAGLTQSAVLSPNRRSSPSTSASTPRPRPHQPRPCCSREGCSGCGRCGGRRGAI